MTSRIPQYKVSVWESIAIALGAIALSTLGLTHLANRFWENASKPQQAEVIASKVMRFDIPGAQGLIGLNLAGAKVAMVRSGETEDPDVVLLVARIPKDQEIGRRRIDRILDTIALEDEQSFRVFGEKVESKTLCDESVLVNVKSGQAQMLDSQKFKPTVSYRTSVTFGDSRYVVNLRTHGADAAERAATIFSSLQCQQ
jgi:hypothetical protein